MMDRVKPFIGMGLKELKPVAPGVMEPRTKLSMGQHCELMAQEWLIPEMNKMSSAL